MLTAVVTCYMCNIGRQLELHEKFILLLIIVCILEAERQEQINRASGEAQAMLAIAEARAKGLELVAIPLKTKVLILIFPERYVSSVYAKFLLSTIILYIYNTEFQFLYYTIIRNIFIYLTQKS